jgi:thymidylate synthase (FAD)
MSALRDEVANDSNYRLVLDHGFIGLIDHMGSDSAIVQGARVSYGKGTKSVREDRGLIRYLMRHRHTSPFELCEVKFRVRAPIFILRQWVRHRTHSMNEESARYSEMLDEFYIPEDALIAPQSSDNKQGRSGELDDEARGNVKWLMQESYKESHQAYKALLGDPDDDGPYYDTEFWNLFPGTARELARSVMPLGAYSSFIWKQNLHNLFHFLGLRADPHAQAEIRAYAEAILDLIRPLFPVAVEAWEDYVRYASHLSRMETDLVKVLLGSPRPAAEKMAELLRSYDGDKGVAEAYGLSPREFREFRTKWGL